MIIIEISYTAPLESIDKMLDEHKNFLEFYYANGTFILSGRKEPRTGGYIISSSNEIDEILTILENDPFKKAALAEYKCTKFLPNMSSPVLKHLLV